MLALAELAHGAAVAEHVCQHEAGVVPQLALDAARDDQQHLAAGLASVHDPDLPAPAHVSLVHHELFATQKLSVRPA